MSYTNEEFERMLATILGGDYEFKTERTNAILKVLSDAGEAQRGHLLTFVLTNYGLIEGSGEPMKDKKMTDERYQELMKNLRSEVFRVFHAWVKKNPAPEELGTKLQKYLFGELTNEEERCVVLSVVMYDQCIPYRRIPDELLEQGITTGDIKEALADGEAEKETKEDAAVIRSILHRRNLTPSTALLLWQIMSRHQSEALRFVIFHQILANLEEETKNDGFGGLGGLGMILGLVRDR